MAEASGTSNAPAANDSPPSYESLNFVSQLKRAKDESSNPAHFVASACQIMCGSCMTFYYFYKVFINFKINKS